MKKWLLLALVLYVASSAASYASFSYLKRDQKPVGSVMVEGDQESLSSEDLLLEIAASEPLDQPCPLNGQMYTQTEKDAWLKRRPLAVMIENSPDARPQSGLGKADVVFEAVAEGGVTRFLAMYLCAAQRQDVVVAPVRSARTYFVNLAAGFKKPLYAHVGGSNIGDHETNALEYLSYIGWTADNDLNQFSIGYPTFVRNYNRVPGKEVATEHTMESSTERLWAVGEKRGWSNLEPDQVIKGKTIPGEDWHQIFVPWQFQAQAPAPGTATKVSYEFWSGYEQYANVWTYDSSTNRYLRQMGGEAHIDLNDDQQISASTVIVMLTDEKGPVDEKKHMIYKTEGTGDALVFMNGQAVEATWSRKKYDDTLQLTDAKGNDLELAPGPIWVAMVDKSTKVTY